MRTLITNDDISRRFIKCSSMFTRSPGTKTVVNPCDGRTTFLLQRLVYPMRQGQPIPITLQNTTWCLTPGETCLG